MSQPTFSYQIKLLEEEIGFAPFGRSGKGAALTPAGAQFITFLANMREDLKRAIQQGQNFSAKYTDSVSVGLIEKAVRRGRRLPAVRTGAVSKRGSHHICR